jgi:predicted acylesterase/phospholipase RssA
MTDAAGLKRILCCGLDPSSLERLVREMPHASSTRDDGGAWRVQHPRAAVECVPAFTVEAAVEVLRTTYVHLLLVDLRSHADGEAGPGGVAAARELLGALDDVPDVEVRYGFHRILALVPGADSTATDGLLVELGSLGVRHVLRASAGAGEEEARFARRVLDRAVELILKRPDTTTALCAAGGGTTAIFFELAALRCLEDCVRPGIVHDFDMYFGISAGAVVTSLIANGYSTDEVMAALAGVDGGRITALDLSLLRLGHLNVRGYARGMRELGTKLVRSAFRAVRGGPRPSLAGLFLDVTELVDAPFHSDRFEAVLRDIMTRPGATNDFWELPRPLYVGASDQDARRHTLFGAERDGITISKAVQSSLSVNPAFTSVEIDGRFYEDGAVTRTSNFVEAIRRGANLIFVLDPFVPYVSKEPGFANRRGMLFNIDQDVRALSFTRFENTRNWVLRRYPEVSSYTLLPNNRLRRLLPINPMDHRPFLSIFRGSYLSTLNRIRQVEHRLRGDLAARGLTLTLDKAAAIADQLLATDEPTLADFFVDRKIDIHRPPLARERGGAAARAAGPAFVARRAMPRFAGY